MLASSGFAGNARYEIVRRLGSGASGIVYEALDRERGARVALKTLTHLDATTLYGFKREFRALADVDHKNLVRLYELVSDADDWFFTMELVDGVEFLDHVWRKKARPDLPARSHARLKEAPKPLPTALPASLANFDRLRSVAVQLASALEALHGADKLHRDIKPSNVLVAREGRVVVVDFGLAKDLQEPKEDESEAGAIIGTPLYMAPEQAAGAELTPAADWYAFGALLYMALTGCAPIAGDMLEVLMEKQRRIPDPPAALVAGVPSDLNALCVDLLQIEPEKRPLGAEVLRRLGAVRLSSAPPRDSVASGKFPSARAPFVGREAVLARLGEAFARVEGGVGEIALVEGTSGMGKSAIVRRFIDSIGGGRASGASLIPPPADRPLADRVLAERTGAVVLEGRCYERESVPYKAFDSVIDALMRYLLQLRPAEQPALMPRDVGALARLFPVLNRVPAVAEFPRRATEGADPQQIRKRAFVALRELLSRLGDRKPLVVFIDDLHWGDADSAALLRELTAPPDPPVMLLLLAFRTEDVATNPPLAELVDRVHGLAAGRSTVTIALDALSLVEARALAIDLLGVDGDLAEAGVGTLAERVASESGGSPFFVGELVRFARSTPGAAAADLRLETVIRERLRALDAGALRLLQVTAVAGRPVAQELAFGAAGLEGDARLSALGILRAASLARAQGTRAGDRVECFHDRIRDAAVASLDAEGLRARHAELARAFEAGGADPEALFLHSNAAGMTDRAREHAVAAAKKASSALAFDRAAQFYRLALELMEPADPRAATLRIELADALANAGRGAEAADAYLASTGLAKVADRLALQRRAAEELLFSGHVDQGMDVISDVLAHFGERFARERWRALLSLVVLRIWLSWRGLSFKPRDAATIPAAHLLKLDVYFSASIGLCIVDTIIAAPFSTRNLLACLRIGEPWFVCRALCQELLMIASEGRAAQNRVEEYLSRARALAAQVNRPDLHALTRATTGFACHFLGEWTRAYEEMRFALAAYAEQAAGPTTGIRALFGQNYTQRWEVDTFKYFSLVALVQLGRLNEVEEKLTRYLRDAKEHGDLYVQTTLQIGDTNVWWLASGAPDTAEAIVTEAMHRWSKRSFQVQHWWEIQALAQVDLYRGRNAAAFSRLRERWGALRRSALMRVQYVRVRAFHLRGRAALALAADGASEGERGALLAAAERDVRRIVRENVAWADPLAALLLAGIARQRGDLEKAKEALERATRGFEAADTGLWWAAARAALGALVEGEAGNALERAAEDEMRRRGVKETAPMLWMMAPGLRSRARRPG